MGRRTEQEDTFSIPYLFRAAFKREGGAQAGGVLANVITGKGALLGVVTREDTPIIDWRSKPWSIIELKGQDNTSSMVASRSLHVSSCVVIHYPYCTTSKIIAGPSSHLLHDPEHNRILQHTSFGSSKEKSRVLV